MKSKIGWTDETINYVTGCTQISPGCDNCYAKGMTKRLQCMGQQKYQAGFDTVVVHPYVLAQLKKRRKAKKFFFNSMGDLFHINVPVVAITDAFTVMNSMPQHAFQILTKRSGRLASISSNLPWSDNIWMGVTVEDQAHLYRIDNLRRTDARIKFISFEPLLSSVGNINLYGIDWVIVGGESGAKARKMEKEWAVEIRDQCIAQGVPLYFKQWGGTNRKKTGRDLDGRTWDEFPNVLRS